MFKIKALSEARGLRVSKVKTIKYRFHRSKVPRCEKTKKQTFRSASSIGADYVSRTKQQIVVLFVANAIKQGVIEARLVLASSTTMF